MGPQYATLKFGRYGAELGPAEIKWTRYTSPSQFLARGDLVYVKIVELNGTQSRVVARARVWRAGSFAGAG